MQVTLVQVTPLFPVQVTRMFALLIMVFLAVVRPIMSQTISGNVCVHFYKENPESSICSIVFQWQTTSDQKSLLQTSDLSSLKFEPSSGPADIVIDDTKIFQTIRGFGAALSTTRIS